MPKPEMATCAICNIEQPLTSMAETLDDGNGTVAHCCYVCEAEETGHKFDSAAALILYQWSMDSGADESMSTDYGDWCDRFGRWLLIGDSQGFIRADEYATVDDAEKTFSEYYDDGMGAQEDDAWISHEWNGPRDTGGWSVAFDGKPLHAWPRNDGSFDQRRAIARVRLESMKTGYYPNLWIVNDHGNVSRIDY